jgi:hypothetical protein
VTEEDLSSLAFVEASALHVEFHLAETFGEIGARALGTVNK